MGVGGVRAVLLDALGTLLELEPPAPLLVAELARRGVAIGEDEAWAALRTEIAYYRAHHDMATDRERLAELRARCTDVLRGALPARARDVPDLEDALLAALRFRAYPEVPATLRALRDDGATLVVVSNWDVSLHEALEATGLAPLLDGAVSSAELGVAKPDPRVFERALAVAAVDASHAVHVGDSLDADVAGALAAGLRAVLVVREGEPVPGPIPDGVPVVRDLRPLEATYA